VWSHTINIDGTNDFDAAGETFATTSAAYSAYVTWDATNLYIGYQGDDVAAADAHKWILVYFDVNPGAGSGTPTRAAKGIDYNNLGASADQQPTFPTGYGAGFHLRWNTNDSIFDTQQYSASTWSAVATPGTSKSRSGKYIEFAIPLATLGNPTAVGVITMMLNENTGSEWTYAGIYGGNFTDGKNPNPFTSYLKADFTSSKAPTDASNKKP
jgi:hypothetical protein